MQPTNSNITHNPQINQLLHEIAEEDNKPVDEILIESLRYYLEIIKRKKLEQNQNNLVIQLALEQQQVFVQALLNPKPANAKLQQSAQNYLHKINE